MDPRSDPIVEALQEVIEQISHKEQQLLSDILALQHHLNHVMATQPVKLISTKMGKPEVKPIEQPIPEQEIMSRIDEIITNTDYEMKEIEKAVPIKPKYELKPLPAPEKKPPLPTLNRVVEKKMTHFVPPKYVPPRNKYEVTGKVTDTPLIRKDKTFMPDHRPVSSHFKTSKNISVDAIKKMPSANPISTEKPPKDLIKQFVRQPSPPKKLEPLQKVELKPKIEEKKSEIVKPFKLAVFEKDSATVMEENEGKKVGNKKHILRRMIDQFSVSSLGYRVKQQKSRESFLRCLGDVCETRNSFNPQVSRCIAQRRWSRCAYTFQFQKCLWSLEQQVAELHADQDTVVEAKHAYRILQTHLRLEQQLSTILEGASAEVPEKIGLSFSFTPMREQGFKEEEQPVINMDQVYRKLVDLLSEVSEASSLSRQQLSRLRVLMEIGMYNSKRSPIIVESQEHESWRDFYLE